ncbi:MAG: hypothetical protein WCO06_01410 [Candidatus Roizmanbacteria bacterium]
MKLSQKQIIKNKLLEKGEVDNLWAINNGMWRLSDIILHLRREGMNIKTIYMEEGVGKNCHYRLVKDTLF